MNVKIGDLVYFLPHNWDNIYEGELGMYIEEQDNIYGHRHRICWFKQPDDYSAELTEELIRYRQNFLDLFTKLE